MRLFDQSAYFINLINHVLVDIRIFIFMLLIIISAFANFFLIINYSDDVKYVGHHFDVGVPAINALIEMYIVGLPELGFIEGWI